MLGVISQNVSMWGDAPLELTEDVIYCRCFAGTYVMGINSKYPDGKE